MSEIVQWVTIYVLHVAAQKHFLGGEFPFGPPRPHHMWYKWCSVTITSDSLRENGVEECSLSDDEGYLSPQETFPSHDKYLVLTTGNPLVNSMNWRSNSYILMNSPECLSFLTSRLSFLSLEVVSFPNPLALEIWLWSCFSRRNALRQLGFLISDAQPEDVTSAVRLHQLFFSLQGGKSATKGENDDLLNIVEVRPQKYLDNRQTVSKTWSWPKELILVWDPNSMQCHHLVNILMTTDECVGGWGFFSQIYYVRNENLDPMYTGLYASWIIKRLIKPTSTTLVPPSTV